jgi:Na+-transporting NADH:ubiquinone oxidoreductase subunit NqrB
METILIKAGGIYSFALVIFHVMFWRLFNWREDLQSLTSLNRAVMQVLNISLTGTFVIFGTISLAHTDQLLATSLGQTLLFTLALFWFIRAVQQVLFFKLRHNRSKAFFLIFLIGCVLYLVPAISTL